MATQMSRMSNGKLTVAILMRGDGIWEGVRPVRCARAYAGATISSRSAAPRGVTSGPGRAPVHVDLAPHPELARQVDARLHRETDAGHQPAVVVGLVVVEVRAGAVQVAVDRVAGPVHEPVAEARPPRSRPARRGRPRTPRSAGPPPPRPAPPPPPRRAPPRTISHTRLTRAGGRSPAKPIQVWSAKTVVRLRPAHRSSSTTSPGRSVASAPACGS